MISHKHRCIFIHISKCAGTTIEKSLGININDQTEDNNQNLFGCNNEHKMFLQHSTPQQLFDANLINQEVWNNYYKFIVIRNPWDRALSDYIWVSKNRRIRDSLSNFIKRRGKFFEILTKKNQNYRGDHLNHQKKYFFLNDQLIQYDKILRFENLNMDLIDLAKELNLKSSFFLKKENVGSKPLSHYSHFYNKTRKELVEVESREDIKFLRFRFEDQRRFCDYLRFFQSDKKIAGL